MSIEEVTVMSLFNIVTIWFLIPEISWDTGSALILQFSVSKENAVVGILIVPVS